jgi:hypothetical protein
LWFLLQVLFLDEATQNEAELMDLYFELLRASERGPHGVSPIMIVFMGLGQLGPVNGEYIIKSVPWNHADAEFAVLSSNHRQQEGDELRSLVVNIANFKAPSEEQLEAVAARCKPYDPSARGAGSSGGAGDMLLITALKKPRDETNNTRLSACKGRPHPAFSADSGTADDLVSILENNSPLEQCCKLKEDARYMISMNQVCTSDLSPLLAQRVFSLAYVKTVPVGGSWPAFRACQFVLEPPQLV